MKTSKRAAVIFMTAAMSCGISFAGCGKAEDGGEMGQESAPSQEQNIQSQDSLSEDGPSEDSPSRDSQSQGKGDSREDGAGNLEEESGEDNPSKLPGEYREVPRMTREEYPVVDGSTATIPLSTALYQLVTGTSPEEAQGAVRHTKTTNAYMSLLYGSADLVIAYEPAQSVYEYMEENGRELVIKPVGKDALVFMANGGNPVTSLSGQQLVDIYSGRYKSWSEVGGDAKEIVAFQRPEGSGSQTLMEKLVMKSVPMAQAPQSYIVGEMGELIENVAAYNNEENALGYSVYFYAQNMYQKPGLTFMAVDGVMPDNETIKNGSYPYVNEFYAAVRSDEPEDSRAYELFQWLTTQEGQEFVESLGYVGIGDTGSRAESAQGDTGRGAESVQGDTDPGAESAQGRSDVDLKDVKLEQGTRLLMDKNYLDGTEGVVVLGENLMEEQTITDKKIDPIAQAVVGDEPVIMTDLTTDRQGLYAVAEGRWVLEPVYDYLSLFGDDIFYGYRDGEPYWAAWDERQRQCRELPGDFRQVGDCWWREEEKIFEIFQGPQFPAQGEEPVRILDFSDRDFSYGYDLRGCYVAVFCEGNQEVYDQQGELLFGKEQLAEGLEGDVYDVTPQAVRMGTWDYSSSYIYNFKEGRIVTEPGDAVDGSIVCDGKGYFSVVRDGESFICDEQGKPILSSEGTVYDRFFGEQYLGNWKDGILTIEKPGTKERCEIPRPEDTGGSVIGGSLFYLDRGINGQRAAIYRGDECVVEDEYLGYSPQEDYCIIYGPKGEIVVDRQGNTLYEGGENEHFMGVYAGCFIIVRGNYVCVTDRDGNCGYQALLGYMADD